MHATVFYIDDEQILLLLSKPAVPDSNSSICYPVPGTRYLGIWDLGSLYPGSWPISAVRG